MENPRRRRITLTHWLLIVIIAALIANAVLQTISIMQRNERAIPELSPEDEAERARWVQEIDAREREFAPAMKALEDRIKQLHRENQIDREKQIDRENENSTPETSPNNSIERHIRLLVNRAGT